MSTLLTVPAELRQSILALCLPDTNHLANPWPPSVLRLFHISSSLRKDMGQVFGTWSPLHYIPRPKNLSNLKAQTIEIDGCVHTPKIERICLDLFHESELNRILWTCFCRGPEFYSHPELIAAWAEAVHLLPKDVREVFLDVTPAPAKKRFAHRVIVRAFVHDKQVARTFLDCHIEDVSALLRAVDKHYQGQVPIALNGTLSLRSRGFINAVALESGVDFVGTWITADEARFKKIKSVIQQTFGPKKRPFHHLYAPLGNVKWSKETTWTFAKIVDGGEEESVIEDLKIFGEFMLDEERHTLAMQPAEPIRRALLHNIAKSVGFTSESEGEGSDRYVVIRKGVESGLENGLENRLESDVEDKVYIIRKAQRWTCC